MARRKKTQKKAASTKHHHKEEKNFRFSVSLIILTAVLEISLFILLLTLVNGQTMKESGSSSFSAASAKSEPPVSANQDLDDADLGFKLVIPSRLGDWKYKIGYVKSLIDDTISDQYLRIYLSEEGAKKSHNFDETNKDLLTIRKFSSGEWAKLEKGCEKGDLVFCGAMGKKIDEKDGSAYAYIKGDGCLSDKPESKCNLIDKIIGSFQLK